MALDHDSRVHLLVVCVSSSRELGVQGQKDSLSWLVGVLWTRQLLVLLSSTHECLCLCVPPPHLKSPGLLLVCLHRDLLELLALLFVVLSFRVHQILNSLLAPEAILCLKAIVSLVS